MYRNKYSNTCYSFITAAVYSDYSKEEREKKTKKVVVMRI